MPHRIVDLRVFRYALMAAEHGSFRRAATAMNVQQSTVSRGVRNLEDRLGANLFERDHAGIRPTLLGDRFLAQAALGFDHLSRALQHAEALQRGDHGQLTVGISVPFAVLGDIFGRFRKDHSAVSVEIVEGTTRWGWSSVEQRAVDVAFVTKTSRDGSLRSLHLRDERMLIVMPKSHPLASERRLGLEDLRRERFILEASGMGPDIGDYLTRQAEKWDAEPRVQLHRVGQCNLINMVASGFGVTIGVGPRPRAASDDVVVIPLAGRNFISLHAVWMESNPNPALKDLLAVLQRSVLSHQQN
jgi:DNA-binding transcriptional LysR family regulator